MTRTCQVRVSRPWRFSTRIDRCLSSRWRDSQEVIERFRSVKLWDFEVWSGRWKSSLSDDEGGVQGRFNCARNGELDATILRTAGRYIDGMRDVLCAVYMMILCQCTEERAETSLKDTFAHHKRESNCRQWCTLRCWRRLLKSFWLKGRENIS